MYYWASTLDALTSRPQFQIANDLGSKMDRDGVRMVVFLEGKQIPAFKRRETLFTRFVN